MLIDVRRLFVADFVAEVAGAMSEGVTRFS
jgi:hypothetical protein